MRHVGLPEFVAGTPDEFEHKGVAWAGNLDRLAQVRAGLRTRFLTSPQWARDLHRGRAGARAAHDVAALVCGPPSADIDAP